MNRGFTIAEIIIAITVIIILAAAAVTGSAGLIRTLRFNNAFNKMIFMVQQARSLAVTGKNSEAVKAYGVRFDFPSSATLYNIQSNDTTQNSEILQLEVTTELAFYSSPNCKIARIQFTNGNGETSLECEGGMQNDPPLLTLGICEGENCINDLNTAPRNKNFSIHRAAGIPQI